MADGTSTSLFQVVLTCNASGTEKLNPKLVCTEEMDDHTQLEPYLTSSVSEPDVYATIDRELEGEMSLYMGADETVQNAVEEHLLNFSSWFVELGRNILVIVGHGIGVNPTIMQTHYPNLKVVLLPEYAGGSPLAD